MLFKNKTIRDPVLGLSPQWQWKGEPGVENDFQSSIVALQQAKARLVRVRPHRAISSLKVTPWLLTQALVLPVVLCTLMFWLKPWLLEFWLLCINFWSAHLGLPIGGMAIQSLGVLSFEVIGGTAAVIPNASNMPLPSTTTMVVTLAVTLISLILSLRLKKASFPLKYPLRIVCVVMLVTLAFFSIWATSFPYTIIRHSVELLTIGFVVMLATPVMLGIGYYILNESFLKKLGYTLLIWVFFAVMVPHQVLVQALLMQHLSVLFMPLLYLCFGSVFNAMVFVALYSWAASNVPQKATI